jgi:hypothetical protein
MGAKGLMICDNDNFRLIVSLQCLLLFCQDCKLEPLLELEP